MKDKIVDYLNNFEELSDLNLDKLVEKPKVLGNGDFSLPCFILSKKFQKNPVEISKYFSDKINENLPEFLDKVTFSGAFLNFFLNFEKEVKNILNSVYDETLFKFEDRFKPKKILIEYPSPNTNKSLHIGHSRNILLGNALCNTLSFVGHNVIRTSMNNDRGIAICKSMLSYQLFGNGETPESKNMKEDEFVSFYYVLYGKKNKENPQLNLDEKAQEMLVKWENGDQDVILLWKKMMKWVREGYLKTFKSYKLAHFDKEYFESDIYKNGKDIVLGALNKKIPGFEKEEDGAICFDFKDKTYGKKYLLRGDGTTLYMTQDLYLASLKDKDFHPDKSIFVVGKEQKYHFEVLFKILEKLEFSSIDKNYHFAYGYVYNEKGEKFSSRLGNTIGADEILEQTISKAKKNLLLKDISKDLNEKEINRRAKIIGYSALAFTFLRVNPLNDMNFSFDLALSFEGETGPYIQYTYARIQSILKRGNFEKNNIDLNQIDYKLFSEIEVNLIKKLKEFNNVVFEASEKYKISLISNYLIKLSQMFNEFYQKVNILKSNKNEKDLRLVLANSCAIVIKKGLEILGIEVLDEM